MVKLTIAAVVGLVSLAAILCGMMSLSSNGLFQGSNNNNNGIYGLHPPRAKSNTQSGVGSSFSLSSGGGGYGYLPPKSVPDNNDSTIDLTTPLFRIFIIPTSTTTASPLSSTFTTSPLAQTTTSSSTSPATTISSTFSTTSTSTTPPTTTTTSTTSSTTATTIVAVTSSTLSPLTTKDTARQEEALAEVTTAASIVAPPSPTPYAYHGNPSPAFKIDLLWSTLVPPSASNSENEVPSNQNMRLSATSAGAGGGGSLSSKVLYLPPPPAKEYLPPKQ